MPNTPVYGWPYQALSDAPDGAALGEDLSLAIEATMADVDTRVQAVEADLATIDPIVTALNTRIGCRIRRVAAQSVPVAPTETAISFDTEDEDTSGMWAIGTPTVITIPEDGVYAISAFAFGVSATGGYAYIVVSSAVTGTPAAWYVSGSVSGRIVAGISLYLEAGDTLGYSVTHTSGANRNYTGFFSCYKVSP